MSDRDKKGLTADEQLKAILYQFISLYDRLAEERQVWAAQGFALMESLKEFTKQVAHFKMIDAQIRKEIQSSLQLEANNLATLIGGRVHEAALKEIELPVRALKKAVDDATDTLSRYQSDLNGVHWKIIFMALFSSLFTSLLIVWLLMPKPTLPLTSQEMHTYSAGEVLQRVWPTLSVREKSKFLERAKEKK